MPEPIPQQPWDAILQTCGAKLLLFARQYVDRRCDAEDVVQEAFARFWRKRDRRQDPESQLPQLFGCVRWAALDWRRRSMRRNRREDAFARDVGPDPIFEDDPTGTGEFAAHLQGALSVLPEEQRAVVTLKIWSGLTFAEIGEALGISPNTAASRHRYALAALKQELEKSMEVKRHGRL